VLGGVSWELTLLILLLVFVYAHYGFAGNTPHVVAMYTAVGTVAIGAGAPPMLTALSFAFMNNLSSGITHYGNGPAVIYFGAGYIDQGTWWRLGAVIAMINLVIWVGLGSIWWKVLGLW
jgi:DASS family divalent anion:Na+ symporter